MAKVYIDPETCRANCPECGYECEVGSDHPEDVCEHFVDFASGRFEFDPEKGEE